LPLPEIDSAPLERDHLTAPRPGIDLLTPVYSTLDLTPQGRDDWYAQLAHAGGQDWPPG